MDLRMLLEFLQGPGGNYTGQPPVPPSLPGFMQGQPSGMALGGIDPTKPNVNSAAKGPMAPPPMPPGLSMMPGATNIPPEMGPQMGLQAPPGGPMALNPPPPMPPQGQPSTVGTPPPMPQSAPPIMAQPQQGFRNQASGLFGGSGRFNLADIISDAMAGAAAGDPTAPPIKAFAQGFTGARASKKVRENDATAAEDKAYEREGTDLDRDNTRLSMEQKRQELADAPRMSRVKYLQALAELSKTVSGDPEEFRRDLQKRALEGGLPLDQKQLDEQTKLAYPDWKAPAAPGVAGKNAPTFGPEYEGKTVKGPDGKQYIIENGKPIPLDVPMM